MEADSRRKNDGLGRSDGFCVFRRITMASIDVYVPSPLPCSKSPAPEGRTDERMDERLTDDRQLSYTTPVIPKSQEIGGGIG